MHYLQCQDKRKPAVKVNQSNKYLKCLSSKAHSSLSFLLLTSDQMNRCGLAQRDDLWQETFHFKAANRIWHSTGFHCGWVHERIQLYLSSYISLVLRWRMEQGRGFPNFPAPACRALEASQRSPRTECSRGWHENAWLSAPHPVSIWHFTISAQSWVSVPKASGKPQAAHQEKVKTLF